MCRAEELSFPSAAFSLLSQLSGAPDNCPEAPSPEKQRQEWE